MSDETLVALRGKRVELKDPHALCDLAIDYGYGQNGLSVDHTKCVDLMRQSAGLGCPDAHYKLGIYHYNGEMGLEQNEEETLKYYTRAAEDGHVQARHNLGCMESNNGNRVAGMRHWRLAASGGDRNSMNCLIDYFEAGLLQHPILAETMQAFYRARAEMKSEDRDQYIKLLKKTGEYKEEYDM